VERFKQAPGLVLLFLVLLVVIIVSLLSGGFISPTDELSPQNDLAVTAQAYRQEEALEEAAGIWLEVLAQDPEDAYAHYQLGLLLVVSDPEKAVVHLDKAADLDSQWSDPAYELKTTLRLAAFAEEPAYRDIQIGQTLAAIGEWDLAKAAFLRSTQENPGYPEAWAYLGEAQQQTGEDGLAALERAIAINPDSYAANVFMALYWRRQARPEMALVYLHTAAQLDPDNPSLQTDIGNTLAEMGNLPDALKHIIRVTQLQPQESSAWQTLARFSVDYDFQIEEIGIHAARQAVILAKDDPAALTLLGRAHMLLGNEYYIERFLFQALQLDDSYPDAHLYLGMFYLDKGDIEKARLHLQTAVQLAGEGPIGQQAQHILDQFFP